MYEEMQEKQQVHSNEENQLVQPFELKDNVDDLSKEQEKADTNDKQKSLVQTSETRAEDDTTKEQDDQERHTMEAEDKISQRTKVNKKSWCEVACIFRDVQQQAKEDADKACIAAKKKQKDKACILGNSPIDFHKIIKENREMKACKNLSLIDY